MRRVIRRGVGLLGAVALVVLAMPAAGQERPGAASSCTTCGSEEQQPKPAPQPPGEKPGSQPKAEVKLERQVEGRPVNLQIELTITDQLESEPAQKKTVSMIVADRSFGRVRSSGTSVIGRGGPVSVQLNVDATPAIQPNDTIRLQLTLEYRPSSPTPPTQEIAMPSVLNESLTVILQPGKPLTVSRAVDPLTNRRTSVDVTATIMK
jgi:hypothetical protein